MIFDKFERKVTKHKNFLNCGIDIARIFDWGEGGNPQITCNITSSEIFKRRDFYGTKIFWNGRSKAWGLG